MIFNVPRGGCLYKVLLTLLFVTACLPVSAQVLIGGTLYEKLDLERKISGDNSGILHDGLFNGPYAATRGGGGTADYSYINVNFNGERQLKGKVIVKFDTYSDQLPTNIRFYATNDGNPPNDVNEPLATIASTSPNTPYMVTLYIPEGNFTSVQMRGQSSDGGAVFRLRELEVLAEMQNKSEFVNLSLNGKLGSSNRTENFNNLINDNNNKWQINYQLPNVVEGEYSSIKVDLGLPYTGYIHWKYTNADMQAPTRLAFYGYDERDWNTKDASTPDINNRWKPIDYCFVDEDPATALANPDALPEDSWYKDGKLFDVTNTDRNEDGKTHDVILHLSADKPYRYIMMRVYDTTGNPNDPNYDGHIAGNTVTDRINDVPYVSNFDLMRLQVSFIPDLVRISKLGFTHTHGVLSPYNKDVWGYQNVPISEPDWEDELADTIEERYGVKFPDFNYMGETKTLQAAHEKEYDIYVIPGDIVTLVPYNGMTKDWYRDGYVRWYDYDNDQAIPDKYFGYHVNPSLGWQIPDGTVSSSAPQQPVGGLIGGIQTLNELSTIAGNNFNLGTASKYRAYFAQFHVPADDNEFKGLKVAADYSMTWDPNKSEPFQNNLISFDSNGNITFIEPPVNYRAVFVIHDGREFAKEISATADANKKYINKHRRIVSAAPGKDFTIRLEFTAPDEPDQPELHSNIYYMKDADGSNYGRVCQFEVVTVGADGAVNNIFSLDNGVNRRDIPQDGYIIEEAGKVFNRFLKCGKGNAVGGTSYTVKIYGLDENGNRIRTADGSADLQIMEYMVSFEIAGNVSMQSMGDYLENLDDNGNLLANANADYLPRHTSQSLRERYGEPYSYQNYDQYLALAKALLESTDRNVGEYFGLSDKFNEAGNYINAPLKSRLPIMWDRSDYVFPYNDDWGWNHYAICNHSTMTAFSKMPGDPDSDPGGRGMFDVSYYLNNKENYKKDANTPDDFKNAGFFFFADAVYDPGTICRIPVAMPCPGSQIHVSAWITEMNDDYTNNMANVIFNFRAKMKDGTVNTIYSYAPGMVEKYREWYHIYFNFVPKVSDVLGDSNVEVESYYISVENNCPSSQGADYAIDDIQIFLQKPEVNLIQLAPICNPEEETDVRLLVECPYDMLIAAGDIKTDDKPELYFCVLDNAKYEETQDLKSSIINIKNNGVADSDIYGKLEFSPTFDGLAPYSNVLTTDPVAMKDYNIYNERCMYFFFTVNGTDLRVGQDLTFCVYVEPNNEDASLDEETLFSLFNVGGECSINSDLRLRGATMIKIDGVGVADRENIICCENQRPVVQLSMIAKPDTDRDIYDPSVGDLLDDSYTEVFENTYYDWYDGPYEDLLKTTLPNSNPEVYNLEVALSHFRQKYPLAETFDMPLTKEYEKNDSLLIAQECNAGKLHLRQSFYIFPEYHIGEDEEGNRPESIKVYATAIPIYVEDPENKNELICLSPVEVPLTIQNQAPVMLHGLGIKYPESMLDVPLRVGLNQIRNAFIDENKDENKRLWLPVRTVTPVTSGVSSLVRPEQAQAAYFRMPDQFVYLVGSNDPRYQSLNPDSPDYNPEEDQYGDFNGLMEVGEVKEIIAKIDGKGNFVGIQFDPKFQPREGYYYKLRYSFVENQEEVGDQYYGEDAPCYGEDVLTIKIVPEYQMWIGEESDDYNDDRNWRRVSSGELLADNLNDLNDFVTDPKAANDNRTSYVPMDFTKVIVPDVNSAEDNTETPAIINLRNIDGDPVVTRPYGENVEPVSQKWATAYDGDIKYDMAAYLDDSSNVQCKLWYHNTCEQIHFNFGAEMLNQGLLKYEKAWVDMDNVPGNWYYLSMPLMETFAGDFYLPTTIGAFQNTKLFEEIRFVGPDVAENQLHDRFKPAVYQRAWNKSSAKIFDKGGNTAGRDVAVLANWSRVYNDVTEKYAPETNPGFSVRTDVGYMDDADEIETVRFRFPKADEEFKYWDQSGENFGHPTEINRKAHYKLNPSEGTMTAEVAEPSKYFLIGNPFICHFDLQEFFKENEEKIESKCWILNNGEVKVIDESMFGSEDEPTAWRYLPPFQGFFVQAHEDAEMILLSYTPEMMASLDGDNLLSVKDRTTPQNPNNIIVTMSAEGESDSQIRFVVGESSEAGDVAAIFNADSRSGMTAYGKSEGLASSIRYVDKVAREEVGVSLRGDKAVTIRFNGTPLDGLMLHDALTGNDTELYDGMEYVVEGSVAGRLFIIPATSDVDSVIALSDFSLEIDGARLTLTAPAGTGNIAMQVFDTEGRVITNVISDSDTVDTTLMPGTYVISAITDLGATFSTKILIRL